MFSCTELLVLQKVKAFSTDKDGEGQGSLACCSPWGCKESDTTEQQQTALYPKNSSAITPPTIHLWKFLFKWFSLDSSRNLQWPPHADKAFCLGSHRALFEALFPTRHTVILFTCFTHQTVHPFERLCSSFLPVFPLLTPVLVSEGMIYWVLEFWDHGHTPRSSLY